MTRRTALSLLATGGVWAKSPTLPERIQRLLENSRLPARGLMGILVEDAASGARLYALAPRRHFVPASNTKLFSTALALTRLGPDHRFHTTAVADRSPDSNGAVSWLTLVGGGDPNLSGRAIPYDPEAEDGEPLAAIEALAGQVADAGVRRVDGPIVGDDSLYRWEPFPDGWAGSDALWGYGAPVSALSINDNAIRLRVLSGDPPRLRLSPALEYFEIDNRVEAGPEQRIQVERDPGGRQLRLTGTLPAKRAGESFLLAVDDPARFAAAALRDALTRRGVAVRGDAQTRHATDNGTRPTAGVELARLTSAPLAELVRIVNKVSQNLHAEMLLRAAAHHAFGDASQGAVAKLLREFLASAGIREDAVDLRDASGLSRLNLVTPEAVVLLLRSMYGSPHRDLWMSLLPVAGEDGTLRSRMRAAPAAGRIRAKTGTLSHVTGLSGYATQADGQVVAFSILANNQAAPSSEVRRLVDKIAEEIAR
ncbi:MAG: D-alanyl-D-alanine carboxypeptidase/D-alanyl-D-alanine-endopeptidase [Bryobacterales bacterium]|nr:D-alanyl-D-alanine carboxypeptidase/D-alanyl-D-alanine-endopeptidase [Bryobacterales bacterium]